jgi:hypothetical protein
MRVQNRARFSRRRLLATTIAAGAGSALRGQAPGATKTGVTIQVGPGAGAAPLGAPVETSVPFVLGALRRADGLVVVSPKSKPVATQTRPAMHWPDGSIRWLSLVFEAEDGPGGYSLQDGRPPAAPDLVTGDGVVRTDTGLTVLDLPAAGWPPAISAYTTDGKIAKIVGGCDLVLTRHDGVAVRAALAGDSGRVIVEERGPLRASIRSEGKCRAEAGAGLFDYILRYTLFKGRPEVLLSVTWVNATDNPSEQVRDIRVRLPFAFEPDRLVFGCERGIYDGPFLEDWPVYILQEDHDQYWAKTLNPDGRLQNLSSGGANGERCPGWLCVEREDKCLGVWVPRFWEEYPNEIAVRVGELSVGLWPERAAAHLLSKPRLPANPDGERPYVKTKYSPVLPHPYVAFLDPETKSLDARQGMAKTQEIVLSVWAGRGESSFEKKWWSRSLKPVRGHVDPPAAAVASPAGPMLARTPGRFLEFETLFDECFGWLHRHIDLLKCYGKFDYGDFKYFTAATDYMTHPGTKWGHHGEMAREGYWHNNEGDTFLGLLLYYLRTGDPRAWERCSIAARHLLDIDIRHYPHWGMYTHSYGHCYVETAPAGEPDHSWLLGLLLWSGVTGDPVARDWVIRCGEQLVRFNRDFRLSDARTVSVHLHMMCQFHLATGEANYLEAAKAPARALLELQNTDGSWPAYMANTERSRTPGFVDHAVMALADYFAITGEARARQAVDKALDYMRSVQTGKPIGELDSPFVLHALAVLAETTSEARYARLASDVLGYFQRVQNLSNNLYTRGDVAWAQLGVNNAEKARTAGRPPQFLNQARPLTVGALLAYGQRCLASIAGLETRRG